MKSNPRRALTSVGLGCLVALCFWALNLDLGGPAYLADEGSYLAKAAVLAGRTVDLPSRWHGGYSFFLVPAFWLRSDPLEVWAWVQLINSVLWGGSFGVLHQLACRLLPSESGGKLAAWTLLAALYPAWVVSAGYALATVSVVFLFLVSLWALDWDQASLGLGVHSFCVGFAYWCHPSSIGLVLASILGLLWAAKQSLVRLPLALAGIGLSSLLTIFYQLFLGPWFLRAVPGDRAVPLYSTYPDTSSLLVSFADPCFWRSLVLCALGAFTYLAVSTFGVALIGWGRAIRSSYTQSGRRSLLYVYLSLSLPLMVLVSAAFLARLATVQVHEGYHSWFQGRYIEIVSPLLLVLGLASSWSRRRFAAMAVFAGLSGALITLTSNPSNTFDRFIHINVMGFWPAVFSEDNFVWWFAAGAAGVLATGVLGKRYSLFLVAPLVVATVQWQLRDHARILGDYSAHTSTAEVVKFYCSPEEPVGVDPDMGTIPGDKEERRNFYSFYLSDHPYQRTYFDSWKKQKKGAYLTFDREKARASGVVAVAKESKLGLFILVPSERFRSYPGPTRGLKVEGAGTESFTRGAFILREDQLGRYSQVGRRVGQAWATDGRAGTLLFGPYQRVEHGNYKLFVEGRFPQPEGAVLDVVGQGGSQKYFEVALGPEASSGNLTYDLTLPEDVGDLEVRVFVQGQTALEIVSLGLRVEGGHP